MELSELRKNIEKNLYSIFINSEVVEWEKQNKDEYKYCEDNICCFFKKDGDKILIAIYLTESEHAAKKCAFDAWYRQVYTIKGKANYTLFSRHLKRKIKMMKKIKKIMNHYKHQEEYQELKKAFDFLPKKIQRKQKLESLE